MGGPLQTAGGVSSRSFTVRSRGHAGRQPKTRSSSAMAKLTKQQSGNTKGQQQSASSSVRL